jgi:hypothetical protein
MNETDEVAMRLLPPTGKRVRRHLNAHADLADLNKMLDALLLGTSDLSGVKTELDKIEVTSAPGPSEQVDVIRVNGEPTYIVRTPAAPEGTDNAAGSALSVPAPSEPPTVTMLSQIEAPAGLMASAFGLAPSSEPTTSAPAPISQIASTFSVTPSSEPVSGTHSASPTPSVPVEPTGTPQDVMTSGNKFQPGETAPQPSGDDSSATQTATPSPSPKDQESPADADSVTSGGGTTSPSNDEGSLSGGEASS